MLNEFSDWAEIFALNESIAMVVPIWDKGMSEICYDIWLLLEVGVRTHGLSFSVLALLQIFNNPDL